ncbi:MAG: O-methyltransferase [Muribaculaceae bacterium]|nr:O-methyltransferase [Muribaculaceae bacterium]
MTPDILDDYISAHIDPEPENLHRLYRSTCLTSTYPRMCTDHLQGRFIKMLTRMIRPSRVLELGTFTGYSALCFAEGMAADGEVVTIEVNDEMENIIRESLANSDVGHKVRLIIGDAFDALKTVEGDFDIAFIDANKRDYVDYYRHVKPRVRRGGFIIADNTLWSGKVVEPDENADAQSRGIAAFNDFVAADTDVEKVILPFADGMTIAWVKEDCL